MAEQSRSEFEQRLMEFMEEHPEFREKLQQDPKAAIAQFLGAELPEDLNIVVHEEDESTLHFVLPPAGDQLSAAEMSSMSGGVCWSDCSCEGYAF